jgi:hypothetical protein
LGPTSDSSTWEGDAVLRALTQQITHLTIDIRQMTTHERSSENLSNIFALILSLFKRLTDLDFCDFNRYCPSILFNLPSTSCMSSTLTTLKMNVKNFDDCLYLLDGRLDSLLTLIIRVDCISSTSTTIDNMVSITFDYCILHKKQSNKSVDVLYFILFL